MLACLLVAILATLVLKLRPLLQTPVAVLAQAPASCNLRQGPCTAEFADGGQVMLAIAPSGIPLVKPLQLKVRLARMRAPLRVEVDFRGVDMDMGYNRVVLEAVADPDERRAPDSHSYRGSGILPLCVRQRMLWEARVLLLEPEGIRAGAFRFETRRGD
ncbi:hypothetical protein Thi970DRAFT_03616 [Thiorhodovibrio frisius]|uniref:Uncharacterized protein n=1 Tax=Thiorhodovibrio frisius TaxID=631362 RepID=H8Z3L5_9GAMM|nr:hypothetical protein Thi970DRAFT_03616 [Thiorhodovibrio frisius]WPL20733.1 hypothetical protein Thiofri_00838 [Thiorhodovibrio frisius]